MRLYWDFRVGNYSTITFTMVIHVWLDNYKGLDLYESVL